MHLAAESHVDRSIDNSKDDESNIIGTYNLLELARNIGQVFHLKGKLI